MLLFKDVNIWGRTVQTQEILNIPGIEMGLMLNVVGIQNEWMNKVMTQFTHALLFRVAKCYQSSV